MAKDKDSAPIKARVLVDGVYGKCNDVVTVPADEATAAGGQLDSDPASVEYAEGLARKAAAINE